VGKRAQESEKNDAEKVGNIMRKRGKEKLKE
jgi:hypothetical protein